MPTELDEQRRKIMQMEIEEAALKKETDKLSAERLENLQKELAELEAQHAAKEPQLPKYEGVATLIDIEQFGKVDLRVAQIKECVPVKRAKKLLKLQLDDGFAGGRQVVSGIAPWYKPEDLIGKKVIIAANLQPVKLCGEESSGMILATDLPDGNVQVIFVDDSVPNGSKLR